MKNKKAFEIFLVSSSFQGYSIHLVASFLAHQASSEMSTNKKEVGVVFWNIGNTYEENFRVNRLHLVPNQFRSVSPESVSLPVKINQIGVFLCKSLRAKIINSRNFTLRKHLNKNYFVYKIRFLIPKGVLFFYCICNLSLMVTAVAQPICALWLKHNYSELPINVSL